MDKKLKTELIKIFSKFNIPKMTVFELIPVKKLKRAKQSYGQNLKEDEVIVLLYDGTAFGSAKEGLLLTNRKIYFKNVFKPSESLALSEVASFSTKSWLEFNINLRNGEIITIITSDTTKTVEKMSLLNEMLVALKKGLLATSNSAVSELICKSCGANVEHQVGKCRYCRAEL